MSKEHTGRLNIINRDAYPQFQPSPLTHYRVKTRIKSLRFVRISPDAEYKILKKKGLNIDITNPKIYSTGNKKPMDGIFSPLFGADTTQDSPIYACDCRELTGAINQGRICSKCKTECRTIESDLRLYGTIDIYPFHILTFHGYNAFCKLLKPKVVKEIITSSMKIDRKGHVIHGDLPTLLDLYDNYEEEYEDKIGLPKDIVFMSKIPVYTPMLRPLIRFGTATMSILEVNKNFMSIVTSRNSIKTAPLIQGLNRSVEIQKTLNQIQQDYLSVIQHVIEQLSGKKGAFRQSLVAGRVDNSARLVISLGTDLMAHEVDLPYQTVMTILEDEIAHYLAVIDDIPISKAISLVEENVCTMNPKFVKIIKQMLKKDFGCWTLVNRNPTISESGVMYHRIRKIHEDPTDMTMHLAQDVLGLYVADFDGDQTTAVLSKNTTYHAIFMPMVPTYAFIDRANGRFNRAMEFKKDYAAIISVAYDIDRLYDRYLTDPDADSYEALKSLGLVPEMSDVSSELTRQMIDGRIKGHFKDRFGPDL